MRIKLLFVAMLILSSTNYSQYYKIVNIIDNNLFVIENGKQVKFYGLFIPSLNDKDSSMKEIAQEIFEWEKVFLLENEFYFKFMGQDDKGVLEAIIVKEHLFYKVNIAEKLLSQGYAALLVSNDKDFNSSFVKFQKRAQQEALGIWDGRILTNENILMSSSITVNNKHFYNAAIYKRPNLPFLSVGIASFALAADYFITAGDIQEQINILKKINADTKDLESIKSRKIFVGILCTVAGIVTTIYSFKKVEVKTNFHSISLSYKF